MVTDFSDEKIYIIKDIPLYYVTPFEVIQGSLDGKDFVLAEEIYKAIKPCTCGGKPVAIQTECMGDFDFGIRCDNPDCHRQVVRSQYDPDIEKAGDEISLAIQDWNDGLDQPAVTKKLKAAITRKKLKEEDFLWKDIYPNNMPSNGKDGEYCIINAKLGNSIFACKWSILFQKPELEPMVVDNESEPELYILFEKKFFDLEDPLVYPEPRDDKSFYGVNHCGHFIRAYYTLEEAKQGALARCGWQNLNKHTIISGQDSSEKNGPEIGKNRT